MTRIDERGKRRGKRDTFQYVKITDVLNLYLRNKNLVILQSPKYIIMAFRSQ